MTIQHFHLTHKKKNCIYFILTKNIIYYILKIQNTINKLYQNLHQNTLKKQTLNIISIMI